VTVSSAVGFGDIAANTDVARLMFATLAALAVVAVDIR
jgi:hypothetical protein